MRLPLPVPVVASGAFEYDPMCVYVMAAFTRGLPSRSRILPETLPPCGIIRANKAIAHNELIMVAPIGTRMPSLCNPMTPQNKPKFHDTGEFPPSERHHSMAARQPGSF